MKIFELLLIAGLLYYYFIHRPRSLKVKLAKEQALKEKAQQSRQQSQSGTKLEKMVECAYCAVRFPANDGLRYDNRDYCSPAHLRAINSAGFLGNCRHVLSTNYDDRPENALIDTIVIHHISLPEGHFGGNAIEEFFCNRLNPQDDPYYPSIVHLKVSAHFLIKRSGEVLQFVATEKRAWHAGASELLGREKCNDFSVGIELEGTGEIPFEENQYQSLKALTEQLFVRYSIAWIVGHSDIAPGRKQDPGKSFDWNYYRKISQIPENKFPFGMSSR